MRTTTLIPFVAFAMHLHGQAGLLDNTFSGDGKTTFAGMGDTYFTAVAVQPDGKILAAGSTGTSNVDFLIVRFNPSGTLDNTFDSDGYVTKGLPGEDRATCIELQPDGKILVAGYYSIGANRNMAIVRLNADGSADTDFGLGGQNFIAFDEDIPTRAEGRGIALQVDGRIIVCGLTDTDAWTDLALARFDADGSIDMTFGTEGKVVVNDFPSNAVAVDNNGRILVAGNYGLGNASCVVHRFLGDGSPDAAFNGGHFVFDIVNGAAHDLHGISLQPNGSVLVAGSCGGHLGAAMLNANGYWDESFDSGGAVQLLSPASGAQGYALQKQADNKFLIAGTFEHNTAPSDLCLARMNGDGSIDNSFGANGWAYYDIEMLVDDGRGMALQNDGKILVAGVDNSVPKKGCVIRVLNDVGIGIPEADAQVHAMSLSPNPATDQVQLHYALTSSSNVTCLIRESSGRVMHTPLNQAARPAGTHTLTMNLEGLSAGAYVVELRSEHGISHHSLIRR